MHLSIEILYLVEYYVYLCAARVRPVDSRRYIIIICAHRQYSVDRYAVPM